MKKIQMMMLMMLVAFVGVAVQSCGDDDPESTQSYTLKFTLQDTGNLDQASAEAMAYKLSNVTKTVKCTESQAKRALDEAMEESVSTFPVDDNEGNYLEYTIKVYLVDSSNKEIYSKLLVIKDGKRTVR